MKPRNETGACRVSRYLPASSLGAVIPVYAEPRTAARAPQLDPQRLGLRGLERPEVGERALQRQGSANTNSVLPRLGRNSGVRALKCPDVPPVPVLTATYWRPSTA
ncbi:MAG: hypothetical protein OXG72_09070 [Acidobacteria bacterium]|nr:hypothetical protein [Acidobacteriota bacterium]